MLFLERSFIDFIILGKNNRRKKVGAEKLRLVIKD